MSIEKIANRLVELCKEGKYDVAQKELYAQNATSTEPEHSPGLKYAEGLDNIVKKGHEFQSMIEAVHGNEVSAPIIAGNFFSVGAILDITMKGMGRVTMTEVAVYKVADGKIVSEEFFY